MDKDTRTKLIEIATKLFATKGFFAVSVREVTSIAQVNVSAISLSLIHILLSTRL